MEILFCLFHNLKIMRMNNYFRNNHSSQFCFCRKSLKLRMNYVETIIRFKFLFIFYFYFRNFEKF